MPLGHSLPATRTRRWRPSLAAAAWLTLAGWPCLLASPAAAQVPAPPSPAPVPDTAEPEAPEGADVSQERAMAAQAAFQRATQLYADGQVEAALQRYEQAYALLPQYKVLYNIASLRLQLGRKAEARRALELHLKLGAQELPAERRAQLQRTLEALERETATLTLLTNVAPEEVMIDAQPVHSNELTGLVLEPGSHVVRISKPGFRPEEREVTVKEGQQLHLVLQLWPVAEVPAPAPPSVASAPPAAAPTPPLPPPAELAQPGPSWLPWAVTGTLAAGWLTTSLLALQARHDRDALERDASTSRRRIEDGRRVHLRLAVASDALLAATLGAAGVSAYLTWWSEESSTPGSLQAALPRRQLPQAWSLGASGQF
jgi:hypothetical protein